MLCLKDTLKGQATRFCHSRAGGNPGFLYSWIPAVADSAGMTAEFCDEAVRRQR